MPVLLTFIFLGFCLNLRVWRMFVSIGMYITRSEINIFLGTWLYIKTEKIRTKNSSVNVPILAQRPVTSYADVYVLLYLMQFAAYRLPGEYGMSLVRFDLRPGNGKKLANASAHLQRATWQQESKSANAQSARKLYIESKGSTFIRGCNIHIFFLRIKAWLESKKWR